MTINWRQLDDLRVFDLAEQRRVIEKWGARARGGAAVDIRHFDFESHGKLFTQVAIVVTPEEPLIVEGRPVVVVASEGGNDNGADFLRDLRGREGIGPWLARRGVTFIGLCRPGRWNFLTERPLGSWIDVPLDRRMPVFHRGQERHWTEDDYLVTDPSDISSPTGSLACRVPRPGSTLEEHMMALTPTTVLEGFRLAHDACLPSPDAQTFYWGFSTGGAYMWSFTRLRPPTGILGYGMTGFPFTRYGIAAANGNFDWPYHRSAFRVRERGRPDFAFYNRGLSETEQDELFAVALNAPRFKSYEDTFMFFNIAALSEALGRLWNAPFLPPQVRARGFAALYQDNIETLFPNAALGATTVLDLYGAEDEVLLTSRDPSLIGEATRPYCRRYTRALLEGLHHSIDAEHAQAFGAFWLDAIEAGFFAGD